MTTESVSEVLLAPDAPLESAGFWIRAGAKVIDWIVLGFDTIMGGVVVILLAALVQRLTGRPLVDDLVAIVEKTTWVGWIGSALATAAYASCYEAIAGSTVGKRLLGLQVVNMDGGPIGLVQAVKRSIAIFVDGLFFGAIGADAMSNSPEKQRIGDRWAGTRVVRRRSLPPDQRTPISRMVMAFFTANVAAVIVHAHTALLEYLRSSGA